MGIYNLELQPNEILINILFPTYPSVYADSIPRLEPHWPTLWLKHTKGFLSQDPSSYSSLCLERSSPRKLLDWSSQRPQRVFPGFTIYTFYICLPLSHPCLFYLERTLPSNIYHIFSCLLSVSRGGG